MAMLFRRISCDPAIEPPDPKMPVHTSRANISRVKSQESITDASQRHFFELDATGSLIEALVL